MDKLMPNIRTEQCNIHPALRSLIRHIIIIQADFGNIPVSIEGNYMPSPDQAMFINLYTRFKSKKSGDAHFKIITSCTLAEIYYRQQSNFPKAIDDKYYTFKN